MAGARIQLKRATAAAWAAANTVLYSGEIGLETDTNKFKIGNGSTAFNSLAYFNGNLSGSTLNDLGDVTINSAANGDFLRWNGTAWINDAVDLATDTTGSFVQSLVAGTGITLTNNSGENSTPTIAVNTSVIQARVADVSDTEIGYLNGVTSAIQTQIDTKAPLASPTFTGTVTVPTPVNNTDASTKTYVDSTASTTAGNAATALTNHEADTTNIHGIADTSILVTTTGTQTLTNKTITTPAGLVKGDVGLGNVDNTSDANKPVSSAGQTALDLKAPLASPTFTGTVVLPDNTVALGTKTTGDYVATITGGTGVTSSAATTGEGTTHTLSIGQGVGTSDNVTFAGVTADNIKVGVTGANEIDTVSGDLTIDSAGGTVTVDDNLTVTGNLTVSGTTTSINTETLTVDDNIIVLNNNATGAPSQNAGIEIERGSSTNVALRWNETSDKWEITTDGSTYADIATETYAASLTPATLDAIGDVTITSASSGQFLKWNGSAWVNDAIDLGTDTTGSYVASLVAGTGITLTNNSGEGATPTVAIGQAVGTSDNVTFASVTAALTGNASTATTLQTARNIAGQSFNGSANISIAPTDLTGVTSTAAELNILDGATLTVTELNYVDGVTSAIQTQINLKAPLASPTFTGTVTVPTPTNGTDAANKTYADGVVTAAKIITAAGGDGTAGQALTTNGSGTLDFTTITGTTEASIISAVGADGSSGQVLKTNGSGDLSFGDVALGTNTTGNYMANVSAGDGITVTHTAGEGSTATISARDVLVRFYMEVM